MLLNCPLKLFWFTLTPAVFKRSLILLIVDDVYTLASSNPHIFLLTPKLQPSEMPFCLSLTNFFFARFFSLATGSSQRQPHYSMFVHVIMLVVSLAFLVQKTRLSTWANFIKGSRTYILRSGSFCSISKLILLGSYIKCKSKTLSDFLKFLFQGLKFTLWNLVCFLGFWLMLLGFSVKWFFILMLHQLSLIFFWTAFLSVLWQGCPVTLLVVHFSAGLLLLSSSWPWRLV